MLIDIADKMLEVSKKRFANLDNVYHLVLDYTNELPSPSKMLLDSNSRHFDTMNSALSIHHLQDETKAKLFQKIYNKLPKGGSFVNYDQFCFDDALMNYQVNQFWERQIKASALTEKDIDLWKERQKLDIECSVETEIAMLKACGFTVVNCLYTYHKFSVILAIK
ncbi:MAG: class I SAM-dependent methyltransferase [Succinatimonas sp.]|nr:class I SAM-dependent methyltransferase [Succinatimonas sp.]MDD5869169.1 class I SAM-dependent methyltransferase [Succinatimonas sp.]MDY5722215.1 class I SAM-dependent methyltransferase [Succinivibrio sp.]